MSLAEVAGVLAEELRPLAETTGHELELDADEGVWALADEERVLQVGRALAGNALAHTPPGTRVVISTRRAGDRAVLEVTDDGPGIAPEHLERIFDRFYRVDGTQASGSGLGLAIARELAQRMGGTVTVETRPGRTVFALQLPGGACSGAELRRLRRSRARFHVKTAGADRARLATVRRGAHPRRDRPRRRRSRDRRHRRRLAGGYRRSRR